MSTITTISVTDEDKSYLKEHGAAKTVRQALLLHRKISELQPFGREEPVSWIKQLKKNLQIFSERNLQLVDRVEVLEGMIKDGMVQQKTVKLRRVREVSEAEYPVDSRSQSTITGITVTVPTSKESKGASEQKTL